MALGQATQEQQEKAAAAAGETTGAAAAASASSSAMANAVISTNRTERGQRLRAVNWVKQVRKHVYIGVLR